MLVNKAKFEIKSSLEYYHMTWRTRKIVCTADLCKKKGNNSEDKRETEPSQWTIEKHCGKENTTRNRAGYNELHSLSVFVIFVGNLINGAQKRGHSRILHESFFFLPCGEPVDQV